MYPCEEPDRGTGDRWQCVRWPIVTIDHEKVLAHYTQLAKEAQEWAAEQVVKEAEEVLTKGKS